MALFFHSDQVNHKYQPGIRWNHILRSPGTVSECGRKSQQTLATRLHTDDTVAPALHHLVRADDEGHRFAVPAAIVEFLSLPAGIVQLVHAGSPLPQCVLHHSDCASSA